MDMDPDIKWVEFAMDVLAFFIGLFIMHQSFCFYRKAKSTGALLWKDTALAALFLGLFVSFAQFYICISDLFPGTISTQIAMEIAGSLGFIVVAYYGYQYMTTMSDRLEELLL